MVRSLPTRALAACLLAALFAWNAPAMALPALVQLTESCAEPPARVATPQPAAVAPAAHQHHAGMHHEMAMPVAAMPVTPAQMNVSDCFQQHTCCSFNREPGKKSEPVSVSEARAATRMAEAPAVRASGATSEVAALPPARAVFDLKSDMRI